MPRLFSIPDFRFGVQRAVGKWSRIATFGVKEKDGARMVFDATSLGEMVDNAARRGDRIAICADHLSAYVAQTGQPAPALGFFDALAVVQSGQCVKSWGGEPNAGVLEDGLYARLGEVTPRGMDELVGLANYAALSPMFTEEGADEAGNPIGFTLYDVAATNTPFQAGTEITFHRLGFESNGDAGLHDPAASSATRRREDTKMDNDLFTKYLGLGEDADPGAVRAAFKAFLNKYDKICSEKEAAEAAEKMAAEHKEPDGDEGKGGEGDGDGDEKKEMAALAQQFGLDPATPRKVLFAAIRNSAVSTAQLDAIRAEAKAQARTEVEAELAQKAALSKGEEITARAVALGMKFDADAERAAFVTFAAGNPAAAEKVIAALPKSRLMTRFTAGGAPVAAKAPETAPATETQSGVRIMGASLSAAAKKLIADGKASDIATAQIMALRADPALAND